MKGVLFGISVINIIIICLSFYGDISNLKYWLKSRTKDLILIVFLAIFPLTNALFLAAIILTIVEDSKISIAIRKLAKKW